MKEEEISSDDERKRNACVPGKIQPHDPPSDLNDKDIP